MNYIFWIILGLIIGWVIEWVIDWLFWRKPGDQSLEKLTLAEAEKGVGTGFAQRFSDSGIFTFAQLTEAKPERVREMVNPFYGDISAYPTIVEATNAKAKEDSSFTVIANPDLIEIGQKLWIPSVTP